MTGALDLAELATDTTPKASMLKTASSNKSIVVNVEFVPMKIDDATPDQIQSLWQWTDETIVPPNLRRELAANGLRVGRVVQREQVDRRLDQMRSTEGVLGQFLSQADVASEVSHGGQRIPMRMGIRYELPVRQPIEGAHVSMVRLDDQLLGRTLVDPQFLFAMTASAGETQQEINLRLRPEIQHGSMRQRWVSSDSALRIDTRRETWSLEELDLNLTGSEGDAFLVGDTNPRIGLGKQMLSGHRSDHAKQQVVMLLTINQIPTAIDQL